MKLSGTVAAAVLLATSAVASPYTREPPHEFTSTYAGAVQVAPPARGQTYTGVSMQFVVPTPAIPKGGNDSWYIGGARVAIDGYAGSHQAALTTGVNWNIDSGGNLAAYPFCAWEPQRAKDYTNNIAVKPGDTVQIAVEATNSTAGTTFIQNLSSGESTSETLAAASGAPGLTGQSALWAVDAYMSNGTALPIADFGTVNFTATAWKASGGATGGIAGATVLDVKRQDKVYTKSNVLADSEIDIVYTG